MSEIHKRLRKFIILLSVLAVCGISYAAVCFHLGVGLPCIFNKITGLLCPGCGISRMFLCLFRGDIRGAWSYNPAVMCLFPFGAAVAVDVSVRYIKRGTLAPRKWANITMGVMIGVLLVFGVLRNFDF